MVIHLVKEALIKGLSRYLLNFDEESIHIGFPFFFVFSLSYAYLLVEHNPLPLSLFSFPFSLS